MRHPELSGNGAGTTGNGAEIGTLEAKVKTSLSAQNTFSNAVRLINFFNPVITGTFSATITVQESFDNVVWTDVSSLNYTTVGVKDAVLAGTNQKNWYRIGIKTGNYTSGTAVVELRQ